MKHWNAISLCQPRIPPASAPHVAKVSKNVNKFCGVYCPHVFLFDVCTTGDTYPIHILKFYDGLEGVTLFLSKLERKCSSIYTIFKYGICLYFRMIFLVCPILILRFRYFRYCSYSIYINIRYIVFIIFLNRFNLLAF